MSYDLQVWSVRPFQQDAFRRPEIWQREPGAWTYARKNWQIVVSVSDRVVLEDIPNELSKLLPGIEWLTNLNLEGKATAEALHLVQSTATEIARFGHGAVVDQQDGSIRLPSGIKRLMSPRSKEMFDVLSLSWWFLDSPIESREGREHFLSLLESILPEACPSATDRMSHLNMFTRKLEKSISWHFWTRICTIQKYGIRIDPSCP